MTKREKNEQIALILGFEKVKYEGQSPQWIYPEHYQYMSSGTPNWQCPDFIQIINRERMIQELTKYGTPKVYAFDSSQDE